MVDPVSNPDETTRNRSRQLVTLGMLAALGGCERELTVHAKAALTAGLTSEELLETALHSAVYCGFPRAMEFMFTIKKVLAEHELLSAS